MRIALFAPSWPPGYLANGIVTYLSQLVPGLRRLGHEVFVLTPLKGTECDDPYTIDLQSFASTRTLWDRAKYRLAPETAKFNAASSAIACAVVRLVEEKKLDVLELEESFGLSYEISRLKLLPVVVRLHGPWFLNGRFNDPGETTPLNRRRQVREGRGIQHAHFVSAPSAEVLQAVKNHYRLKLTASRVISNPINAVVEAEAWNVSTCNNYTLLFVGRFDRRKGGDFVLRAFAELARSNPGLKLTFVGPDIGIKEVDGKVWFFEQFVRTNFPERCWSRIEFCGQKNHLDVMSLRAKHFVTIIASQYEIAPYSILEAMACGCPLVATAVGGIPELIKNERNGLLVPSQDVKAMTAACQKLLDDKALAGLIGRQAWQDCREFHGSENIAKQTIALYQEAIDTFRFSNAA
jgi:glycosyltransferase involved in cell wall biosynthesis